MNINTNTELKKCPKCGEIKNRKTDFYQLKGETIKVNGFCKPCLLKSNAERRRIVKEKAVEYLGGACKICGYNKCIGSLDFHHINPKEKEINYSLFKTIFNKRLIDELDKCILLCANCHRELHYNEETLGKH
jgi:hypothetical protein